MNEQLRGRLIDALREDRSATNTAFGDGAWDVADVIAVVERVLG